MKKKTIGKEYLFTALILFVVLAVTMVLDSQLPSYHIVIKVIKKASVYSLVAVSMNLLNGFTGLFSLGQAGFMLLGAYSYAVLCIPAAKRAGVYQYFDGGIVKFSLPEIFASFLGDKVGSAVGMILALLVGGLIAAFFAYLIGLPVLRLKSDYLAIATLGFAEIMRTIIQWNAIGPLTNIAAALTERPALASQAKLILMGGRAADNGEAEWNFACDPEAARIVLSSGMDITLIGLDVTERCPMTLKITTALGRAESAPAKELTRLVARFTAENGKPFLHDPLAMAEALNPGLVRLEPMALTVAEDGRLLPAGKGAAPNVRAAVDGELTAFLSYFQETICR